ncbi:MAG: hypothetical protein ACFFCE_02830 [Promethearchaeota archaeon]
MKGDLIISIIFITIFLILHFTIRTKTLNIITIEIFLAIFGVLGLVFRFLLSFRLREDYDMGKWVLKEIKGACKGCKINKNSFIPNKRVTPKREREPIAWREVESIDIQILYQPPSSDEVSGHYNHYLKVNLKDGRTPKLILITFSLSDKGNNNFVILMKKFCEFLIEINQ